jgi:Ca-activated chloride channel family protein
MNMTFGSPEWFWGLLAIPVMFALFLRAEHRGAQRLRAFVSARLLPQLSATVNRPRRILRFALQILGLVLAIVALAQPRWGYTFLDVKRKGLDLLIAVDTSRSMLSNDVQPNRLERVKLATHDMINEMQGDRVGLIAFAGRAFLQAPLTIDYDAALESVNALDTTIIPEGGTNISEAIKLAVQTFGKSAMGNRALIIFTDGEELSGDAVKSAKAAANEGVRIFTVGVGTPQGSLIPLTGEDGGTAFVKDENGQVVKSKLDDNRLKEIAEATGGFYAHLENGPRTMQFLYTEGLGKMQAAEIDTRLSRQPIERYEWPLSGAVVALALSMLIRERKSATGRIRRGERARVRSRVRIPAQTTIATATLLLACCSIVRSESLGLSAYNEGKFDQAYTEFQQTLQAHPKSRAEDKLQFDSGAAAYKKRDYEKALESFSQALLSPETGLQAKSHYNLGNTLYQRGEQQKTNANKLTNWTNALDHYDQTLKLDPQDREAKENYEFVKRKIDELKKNKEQPPPPSPSPSPTPPQQNQKQKNQNQQPQQSQQQQQNQQQNQQQQPQQQNQQQQQKGGQSQQQQKDQQQQPQDQQSQGQGQQKNEQQKSQKPEPSQSQSPSPDENSPKQNQKGRAEESPSPEPGSTPPTTSPSPPPGEGEGEDAGGEQSATPSESPGKGMTGELKEASEPDSQKQDEAAEIADAEAEKEGKMSERQALALLQSMKDEEAKVRLDERRAARHVYKDW